MTNAPHYKFTMLFEKQVKLETELKKVHVRIQEVVEPSERRVRVERLICTSQEVLVKAVPKTEELFALTDETSSPETLANQLKD